MKLVNPTGDLLVNDESRLRLWIDSRGKPVGDMKGPVDREVIVSHLPRSRIVIFSSPHPILLGRELNLGVIHLSTHEGVTEFSTGFLKPSSETAQSNETLIAGAESADGKYLLATIGDYPKFGGVSGGQSFARCFAIVDEKPKFLWESMRRDSESESLGLGFAPDGKTSVTQVFTRATKTSSLRFQESSTGHTRSTVEIALPPPCFYRPGTAFCGSGETFVVSDAKCLLAIDWRQSRIIGLIPGSSGTAISIAGDGRILAACYEDGSMRIWRCRPFGFN